MKTLLFDLDATLLPMDQDEFIKSYFKLIALTFGKRGVDINKFMETIKNGTFAMLSNDGSKTNESIFKDIFMPEFGSEFDTLNDFYNKEFDTLKEKCSFNPTVPKTIKYLKSKGYRLVLASNPVFPVEAQKKRVIWAGLDPQDFFYYTSYANSSYCKPNPGYYFEILKNLCLKKDDCLMVGNDTSDDMAARDAGIDVFLITDCLINKENKDISSYPNGNFDDLIKYIESK